MELWEALVLAGGCLWIGFQVGKSYGRDREREFRRISQQLDRETDPQRRDELRAQYAELIEDPRFRKAFKKATGGKN